MSEGHLSTDVVVTGLGVVSPGGLDVAASWDAALAGKPAASFDPALADADVDVALSCRVPPFDVGERLGSKAARRLDRYTHLAVLAAREALMGAGLTDGESAVADGDRVAVIVGCGIGGAASWESEHDVLRERGPGRVSPLFLTKMLSNTAAGEIAIRYGLRGPNLTVNTACASAASALAMGRDLIRSGAADVVVAGGAEAGVTPLGVAAFTNMTALSRNPDPLTASRPFDTDRDGFVIGEGAGLLVLESAEHAARRGADALAHLAGAGMSADAHHATAPPDDGGGAVLAMRRALETAGVAPRDIAHVNAHGTSTPLNDRAEARAIRTVFGDHDPVVTSTKGVTGHLLGAAGGVEAAFTVLALRHGVAPPTAGLVNRDPEIDLDVVAGRPRPFEGTAAISNSFGFGGQNASVLFTSVAS